MDSLARVPPDDVVYEDLVAVDNRLSGIPRDEQKCNFIVALSQCAGPTTSAPLWMQTTWTAFPPGMTSLFRCCM